MATNSGLVPYSNPAQQPGQTSSTSSSTNPYVPPTAVAAPAPYSNIPVGTSPNTAATNSLPIVPGGVASNNLETQLVDIYGQGVGASEFNLINNMSGTDSAALQEYIQSLAPAEAAGQANLNASLGAGGVSSNSSVAAIGNANLQSQEFSSIAGQSENLTLSQEELTAQLLQGFQGSAAQEVASSPWTTLGNVMGAITSDVGALLGGTPKQVNPAQTSPSTVNANGMTSAENSDLLSQGTVPTNQLDPTVVAQAESTEDLSAMFG
jgi:hypothetical protein